MPKAFSCAYIPTFRCRVNRFLSWSFNVGNTLTGHFSSSTSSVSSSFSCVAVLAHLLAFLLVAETARRLVAGRDRGWEAMDKGRK